MRRTHAPPITVFAPCLIVVALVLAAGVYTNAHKPDPFDQRNFPCQEDEAQVYDPRFGPDRTGCINTEELP